MKNISLIKAELQLLMEEDRSFMTKAQISKSKKTIQFLKLCIAYLETGPSPSFLASEQARIKNRINLLEMQFKEWITGDTFQNDKKKAASYRKMVGIPALRTQLRTIIFLSQ